MRIALLFGLCILAIGGVVLYPEWALAIGDDVATASFSCSDGKATGQLYTSSKCPETLSMSNFFSFMVCNMEQLSSNVMGHMYCGMIKSLEPAVWAATTLAITLFAVSFTIGLTSLSRGGAIMFLLKITFVTAFATNADMLIGVGYKFFISGISDGVTMVLSRADNTDLKTGADVYKLMDGFLKEAFHFATDSIVPSDKTGAAANAAANARCKNAIFAVMVTMAAAFPLITYLGLALLARIVVTFFRAVFGYIYALVGITFLMILAPIFLCFYLFKETQSFFDKWIGYLTSFMLQIILLFAFMTFILSLSVSNLTRNLSNIIVFKAETADTSSFRFPWEYCTLCDFEIVEKSDTNSTSTSSNSGKKLSPDDPDLITKGELQCIKHPANKDGANADGIKPLTATFMMAPKQNKNELNALVELAGKGLLSLIILAWIVERMLTMLPSLAQRLGAGLGGQMAPQLGGGYSSSGATATTMPGESLMKDFNAGFNRGFAATAGGSPTSFNANAGRTSGDGISSAVQGVTDGMSMMISGRMASRKDESGKMQDSKPEKNAGVGNHFMRWLADPGRFDH